MQSVNQAFHNRSQQGIRPHTFGVRISFDREFDDTIEFGMWDVSVWDGGDLWRPVEDNPIQEWEFYVYTDLTDRLVDQEWSREIEFPYSVQSALADFSLNNYDNYFTPGFGSPVDGDILPKRPVRLFAGYQGVGTLQQFVGMTQRMPVLDAKEKTAKFYALDFLSEIFNLPLEDTIAMNDVRTDQVLDAIFQQFGLTPSQYTLAYARNVIPFVFFEKGKNAGNAMRELMQAEMGNLWLDEQGIIRFEERLMEEQTPVMRFNDSNVEDISTTGDSEIINTVRIRSDVREVQELQPVFISSENAENLENLGYLEPIEIPGNSTQFGRVELNDPLLTANTPVLNGVITDSWFTVEDASGNPVNSDVSITLTTLNNNNYVMLFQNDNAFEVKISELVVWGEPAKIVDEIRYEAFDEDSVAAYDEQLLEIDNNFFGSEANCESFALTIIDAYKDFASVIEMSVKGDYSLQLGDIIEVLTREIEGTFKVIRISNRMRSSRSEQIIKARHYEARNWARWDVSLWDGGDLFAP